MAQVRFKIDAPVKGKDYKKDDLATFTDGVAAVLVRDGLAEIVPAEKKTPDAPAS